MTLESRAEAVYISTLRWNYMMDLSLGRILDKIDEFPEHIVEAARQSQYSYMRMRAEKDNRPLGQANPRPKPVKLDTDWIVDHGSTEVDVANTPFDQLAAEWKMDTLDSIGVAYAALSQFRDPEFAAECVHVAFLCRREAMGIEIPEDVKDDYRLLSEELKEYDREPVRIAQGLLK